MINISKNQAFDETENHLNQNDGVSFSDYRSATSSSFLSDNHHPLSSRILSEPSESHPLLSPTFTEDVSTRPLDNKSINGVDTRRISTDSPSSSSDCIKITVSNPQREQETSNSLVPGGNTYFTYLITTRTNVPDYNGSEFVVRRRFRDVVALSERLAASYRGFIIPPRPDKNAVESRMMDKQEFVEQRSVALEKYLRRLAAHPVIRNSYELKVFLQGNDTPNHLSGESSAVAPQEVVHPAKGGRDLLKLFKKLRQSVSNDLVRSRPTVAEEDKEFMEKKKNLKDLELQISNASKQAESLVKAQQDMSDTIGELGLAFIKLTKFENEEAEFNSQRVRAANMKSVATAAIKASRFYRGLNSQTVKHLVPLHDNLSLMLSVRSAFTDRSSAVLTVQTLTKELSSLRLNAEKLETISSKLFGDDKPRIHKLEELKETIKATEDAKNVAMRELVQIKENNRRELERMDCERRVDFLNMLKGLVQNQVEYAEKISLVWAKVAEDTSVYAKESSS